MRFIFATDLHGSELVFDKLCRLATAQECNVLILSGDLIGKEIYQVFRESRGSFLANSVGQKLSAKMSDDELARQEGTLAAKGVYLVELAQKERKRFSEDVGFRAQLLLDEACARLRTWLLRLQDELCSSGCCVLVAPGNDDPYEVDDLVRAHQGETLQILVDRPVEMGPVRLVPLDRVNPSGLWNTFRESTEDELTDLIEDRIAVLPDKRNLIFCFHPPPLGTKLDVAFALDESLRVRVDSLRGARVTHCGSRAVRQAILAHEPKLSLHGHIHESQGVEWLGPSLCVNPGSAYRLGLLKAFVFDVDAAIVPRGIYDEDAESSWRMVF